MKNGVCLKVLFAENKVFSISRVIKQKKITLSFLISTFSFQKISYGAFVKENLLKMNDSGCFDEVQPGR